MVTGELFVYSFCHALFSSCCGVVMMTGKALVSIRSRGFVTGCS